MLTTTDDLRVKEIKELSTPDEVMREIPRSLTATRTVTASRNAAHAMLLGRDDRLLVVVGPCSIHDPVAAIDYASRLAELREQPLRPARDRDAGLFRKAAHHGWLEGPDQRSRPRWQLQHRQGTAPGPQRARRGQQSRPAGGDRIPRHDDAAVHRRSCGLGGDRSAHHGEPDSSRTGLGPLLPGRLQERHRRQSAHRSRCCSVGRLPASFHGGDEERPLGYRVDDGQ